MAPLRVEVVEGLAVVTLDRPEVLNAFNEELTTALGEAVAMVAEDAAVRCVMITGAGRAFSAGQDLRDRAAMLEQGTELRLGDELRRRYHPIVRRIREMPKPVVAAVNGIVAGAGFGLMCACDVRIASTEATFRAAWSRVGLVPDAGSAYFLPRIVGWGRALDMILTAEVVDAEQAFRMGLVTRVFDAATFADDARMFCLRLAAGATLAYALAKRGLEQAWSLELEEFMEAEAAHQDEAGRSRDYAEGVRAFLEKRQARFEGR